MENKSVDSIIASLKKLAIHCNSMQEILVDDRSHIADNYLHLLEENNKKKIELIEQLNRLVSDMKKNYPQGMLNQLEESQDSDHPQNQELQKMVKELNAGIKVCYHHINMNSNIVFSNLNRLKTIWDKLLSIQSKENSTYDQTGHMVK